MELSRAISALVGAAVGLTAGYALWGSGDAHRALDLAQQGLVLRHLRAATLNLILGDALEIFRDAAHAAGCAARDADRLHVEPNAAHRPFPGLG